ncbi:MAG: US12 family protein [Alphaproteobacteria bacterium]|nr:US12 family protein [Alphaproteobacteria bacterium]
MAFAPSVPLSHAPDEARVAYLRSVAGLTFVGLVIAGVTGTLSAIFVAPLVFQLGRWGVFAVVMGTFGIANWVAPKMVYGSQKWLGFILGMVCEGIALGLLLLAAVLMGTSLGNPLGLVGSAMGLTALTALGITGYVWTGPKQLSMVGAGLSALMIPMLVLMVVGFAFPGLFGGPLGIVLSAVFVIVSAAGLLYQTNEVMHQMSTDMKMEGAYTIAMGLLILFWNLLSLLMRLNSRD